MTALAISTVFFICAFGAALAGMKPRYILPDHHLNDESRDAPLEFAFDRINQ